MKDLKTGDSVILKGFTGMALGVFRVNSNDGKEITVKKKNGDLLKFDMTGTQTNYKSKKKYACSIIPDDGSYVKPTRKKKGK